MDATLRRYVPSDVVNYIDRSFQYLPKDGPGNQNIDILSPQILAALLGLVDIVDRVPEHLVIDTGTLTDIILSSQAIQVVVRAGELNGRSDIPLRPISPNQLNPVIVIRNAFAPAVPTKPLCRMHKGSRLSRTIYLGVLWKPISTALAGRSRAGNGNRRPCWGGPCRGIAVVGDPTKAGRDASRDRATQESEQA